MPTTASKVRGVATGWPSSRSGSPAGLVASVIETLRGRMSRWTVCVAPAASRTVR